ncbi:MAG: 4Fe-4S dicluster domain-containing protein [Gemmatimonadetes bacterium]|nr:MAG: 4Fe-4S dicluster domain-containing protein [Gemmatimonadota bacterium]
MVVAYNLLVGRLYGGNVRLRYENKIIKVDENLCDICGVCVSVCPVDCIDMPERALIVHNDTCIQCNKCIDICPVRALRYDEKI